MDGDAEILKSAKRIRHQAFAAGFVDGRLCAIRNRDVKTSLACGDRGGQPSRPAAHHKHVCSSPHPCSSKKSVVPISGIA
jgi:hypothetical protein